MVGDGSRCGCSSSRGDADGDGDREVVESPARLLSSLLGSLASAGRPKDSMSSGKEGRADMAKKEKEMRNG